MNLKTPGVHVEEISTFPPSVVPVQTAIPAFIGYTERAVGADGSDLTGVPTRVRSLLDFQQRFGGDFRPATYRVRLDAASLELGTVTPLDAADTARRYFLYASVRHFYANGGGACYVVSVGDYGDAPALGDAVTPASLRGGLAALEPVDEPTLLLFPDAVSLVLDDLASLQQAALAQCARLQDRFVLTDLGGGDTAITPTNDPVGDFRQRVGTSNLKYGAAYYPWVDTVYRPAVQFRQLRLVDATDTPHADGVLDTLTSDAEIDGLVPAARDAEADAAAVVAAVASGLGASSGLGRDNFAALESRFATAQQALRDTDDSLVGPIRDAFGALVALPRSLALALGSLDAAIGLDAEIAREVDALAADGGLVETVVDLISLEKNEDVRNAVATGRTVGDVESDYSALDGTPWIDPHTDSTGPPVEPTDFGDTSPTAALRQTALAAAAAFEAPFRRLAAAVLAIHETADLLAADAQRRLFTRHPVYEAAAERAARTAARLPAAGGVAGVYATIDRTRGVWKAPANVSLADVVAPAVKLNDADQAGLNVHPTGKSVNAIRAFTGKGTLVWGSRTLAGNDAEWRYVPVRRFFNMAEESIRKATQPFVFEPNDAGTWVRVRAMIENFLTVQWRQGALAGAVPAQAFYVRIGLGETMTPLDVLEGRMIIEVGMAVVRPAEFIVLKFAHKMQLS